LLEESFLNDGSADEREPEAAAEPARERAG
jgi:hypothetical protein